MRRPRNCSCGNTCQCAPCAAKARAAYVKRHKIEFGAFLWRADGLYAKANALAVFKREATTEKWCEDHADEHGGLSKLAIRDVYPD
jgi:hypothetical protein